MIIMPTIPTYQDWTTKHLSQRPSAGLKNPRPLSANGLIDPANYADAPFWPSSTTEVPPLPPAQPKTTKKPVEIPLAKATTFKPRTTTTLKPRTTTTLKPRTTTLKPKITTTTTALVVDDWKPMPKTNVTSSAPPRPPPNGGVTGQIPKETRAKNNNNSSTSSTANRLQKSVKPKQQQGQQGQQNNPNDVVITFHVGPTIPPAEPTSSHHQQQQRPTPQEWLQHPQQQQQQQQQQQNKGPGFVASSLLSVNKENQHSSADDFLPVVKVSSTGPLVYLGPVSPTGQPQLSYATSPITSPYPYIVDTYQPAVQYYEDPVVQQKPATNYQQPTVQYYEEPPKVVTYQQQPVSTYQPAVQYYEEPSQKPSVTGIYQQQQPTVQYYDDGLGGNYQTAAVSAYLGVSETDKPAVQLYEEVPQYQNYQTQSLHYVDQANHHHQQTPAAGITYKTPIQTYVEPQKTIGPYQQQQPYEEQQIYQQTPTVSTYQQQTSPVGPPIFYETAKPQINIQPQQPVTTFKTPIQTYVEPQKALVNYQQPTVQYYEQPQKQVNYQQQQQPVSTYQPAVQYYEEPLQKQVNYQQQQQPIINYQPIVQQQEQYNYQIPAPREPITQQQQQPINNYFIEQQPFYAPQQFSREPSAVVFVPTAPSTRPVYKVLLTVASDYRVQLGDHERVHHPGDVIREQRETIQTQQQQQEFLLQQQQQQLQQQLWQQQQSVTPPPPSLIVTSTQQPATTKKKNMLTDQANKFKKLMGDQLINKGPIATIKSMMTHHSPGGNLPLTPTAEISHLPLEPRPKSLAAASTVVQQVVHSPFNSPAAQIIQGEWQPRTASSTTTTVNGEEVKIEKFTAHSAGVFRPSLLLSAAKPTSRQSDDYDYDHSDTQQHDTTDHHDDDRIKKFVNRPNQHSTRKNQNRMDFFE